MIINNKALLLMTTIGSAILLSSCSSEFLRAMDEVVAAQGGQRTCQYERAKQTDRYDDMLVTWGGYCNSWEISVQNISPFTLKCRLDNGGNVLYSNLYVPPRQTRENTNVAHMRNAFYYDCQKWSRPAHEAKRSGPLVLFEKMESGSIYNQIKNNTNRKRECYIKKSKNSSSYYLKQVVAPYGVTAWKAINGGFSYGCRDI